jgi:hypothetical protein
MKNWMARSALRLLEDGAFLLCLVVQAAMVMGGWAMVVEHLSPAP